MTHSGRRSARCLALVCPLLLSLFHSANAQPDSTGTWVTRALLPTPRQEVAHAVIGGKIYVPGGLAQGGVGSAVMEVFDPATNAWLVAAPMPEALHHMGLAAVNDRLFVLGGYVGNTFTPTNRVYEYLPDSNLWRQRASMPVARGAHAAVAFGGRIYVIGGVQAGGATQRNDVYNPATNSWQTLPNMPTAREHLAGAAIDSLIYIVGGRVGAGNLNTLEAFSPATNTWYVRASMPTARSGLAASALGGRLYVFGGEIPGVFPQNEEYDPRTNSWRMMAPMPTPRHGIGAATVGDSIFIIGGGAVQGFGVSDANEAFLPPLPTFHASPGALFFGMIPVSQCKSESVKVRNNGVVPLEVYAAQSTNPRFYVSPTTATVQPGDSTYFRVLFCADFPVGTQTGFAVFRHNAGRTRDTVFLSADVITSAGEERNLPASFVLYQNHPNPFNPSTTIRYLLPARSIVSAEFPETPEVILRVHDLPGRVVHVQLLGRQQPGLHEVVFDAGDLASGVYLYRIEAGRFRATRKMVLLR